MRHPKRLLASLLLVAVCGLALTSAALARPPFHRAYGCYGIVNGNLNYIGSFELVSSSVYMWAADQAGTRLKGKTHRARYRLSGNRLKFLTGPYKPYLGLYIRKSKTGSARVNLYKPTYRNWTGISCQLS